MNDSFTRELTLLVDELKSPKARSRMLAAFAREEIAAHHARLEVEAGDDIAKPKVTVDGRPGAALGTVKPDGTIVAEFNTETEVVRWIHVQLMAESPRLTGAYQKSHVLFVDGVEHSGEGEIPAAREYVFVSDLPYAKKLDPKDGLPARSKQSPRGVYAAVAAVAGTRFDHQADVFFTFRDVPLKDGGTARNPAIVVRPT